MKVDLAVWFDDEKFIQETCLQMNKDLIGLMDSPILFPSEPLLDPLEEIAGILMPVLEKLDQKSRLAELIYRVDLEEHFFQECVSTRAYDRLARMLITREAQKVFLRRKFRVE